MISRTYDLHGVRLEVVAGGGALREGIDLLLGPFLSESTGHPIYQMTIRTGDPPASGDGLALIDSTPLADGRVMLHHADSTRRITFLEGSFWHHFDLETGLAEVVIREGQEARLESASLTPLLCEMLGRFRYHVFHAATLVAETAAGPQAILLSGASGAGKTTSSLSLSRGGFRLLTDDSTVLVRREGQIRVFGLPRPCRVHRRTYELLGWMGSLEPEPCWRNDEFTLPLSRVSKIDPLLEVPAGLVVLLQPRNDEGHRIEPCDRLEAATELTRQSVRSLGGFGVDSAADCFAMVGEVARGVRTVRLSIGPDLETLGDVLRRELEN